MPQWFYQDGEEVVGPLKASDMLRLVRDQTITRETMVRKDQSAWFPASDVGGLFQAAAKPTVQFTCPECGSSVGKPPCYCRRCRRLLEYARPHVTENVVEGYERPDQEKETITDAWKQWVRRLRRQGEGHLGSGGQSE